MPRGTTDRILVRQHQVLKVIENETCATTRQIIQALGLTHSQAFYVLQQLRDQGLIEEYVIGKLSIWCIAGHVVNDVYIVDVLISVSDLERAICKILENVRGHKATIRVSWVVDKIAENVRANLQQPLLLTYVSEILATMLSNVEKSVFVNGKGIEFYVVDTCSICRCFRECSVCEMLRKKLNCLD